MTEFNLTKITKAIYNENNYTNKNSEMTIEEFEYFKMIALKKDQKQFVAEGKSKIVENDESCEEYTLYEGEGLLSSKTTSISEGAIQIHSFTFDSSFAWIIHSKSYDYQFTQTSKKAVIVEGTKNYHFVIYESHVEKIDIGDIRPIFASFGAQSEAKINIHFQAFPGEQYPKIDKTDSLNFEPDDTALTGYILPTAKSIKIDPSNIFIMHTHFNNVTTQNKRKESKYHKMVPKEYQIESRLILMDNIFFIPKSLLQ